MLQQQSEQAIEVEGVTTRTLKRFFVWTHALQPGISPELEFEDATELGIFASRFQIPALSNQITDRLRSHLASDEWQLNATIVGQIYDAAPNGSPLREVIRAALGKLSKPTVEAGEDREAWGATVLRHPQLGLDFFGASGSSWNADAYLSGVCRFHDHDDVLEQKNDEALCDGCPYASEDCYPLSIPTNAAVTPSKVVAVPKKSAKIINGDAVHGIAGKPEDGFVDEMMPATTRQRVGNGIMITDDDFYNPKVNGLSSILESAVETSGGRPHLLKNGTIESDDAIDDANELVTSEDQADETTNARTIGTMTEVLNGEADAAGEKADDEAPKMARSKSKNKKKKRGPSFSVAAN